MAMGMLYPLDIKALGKGVRAMRCAGCGAEVILTNVVPENTVAVRFFGGVPRLVVPDKKQFQRSRRWR